MKSVRLELQVRVNIEIKSKIDISELIEQFVSDLDYSIKSCTKHVKVVETEILGYDTKNTVEITRKVKH